MFAAVVTSRTFVWSMTGVIALGPRACAGIHDAKSVADGDTYKAAKQSKLAKMISIKQTKKTEWMVLLKNVSRVLPKLFCMAWFSFWSPVATAQGVQVTDLTKSDKAAAGFTLNGKATKAIETPWGQNEIYDPLQDVCAKDAFVSLYNFANEDAYFQSRPVSLFERSRRDPTRYQSIADRQDVKYLNAARNQSLLQMQDAGCSFVATRNCTNLSVILSPPSTCRFGDRKEYPFLTEMVGDPLRGSGSLDRQFEMFFENACNVWEQEKE